MDQIREMVMARYNERLEILEDLYSDGFMSDEACYMSVDEPCFDLTSIDSLCCFDSVGESDIADIYPDIYGLATSMETQWESELDSFIALADTMDPVTTRHAITTMSLPSTAKSHDDPTIGTTLMNTVHDVHVSPTYASSLQYTVSGIGIAANASSHVTPSTVDVDVGLLPFDRGPVDCSLPDHPSTEAMPRVHSQRLAMTTATDTTLLPFDRGPELAVNLVSETARVPQMERRSMGSVDSPISYSGLTCCNPATCYMLEWCKHSSVRSRSTTVGPYAVDSMNPSLL
jgi:hypothetical protein